MGGRTRGLQVMWAALLAAGPSLAAGSVAGAQDNAAPPGMVTGRVLSQEGIPLPSAIVTLRPGRRDSVQGLTDADGRYRLVAGTRDPVVVRARAIGFRPDSVEVTPGRPADLRLTLLPRSLRATLVRGIQCTPDDERRLAADGNLQELLAQARLNAEQYRLAAAQLPFLLATTHRVEMRRRNGDTSRVERRTVAGPELAQPGYKRGRVLFEHNRKWYVVVPMAAELSGPAFLREHCAVYQGMREVQGEPMHHIALAPKAGIRTPDLGGDLFLDSATFVVRRAVYRLLNVERSKANVRTLEVEITFDRHPSGLVLPLFMTVIQDLQPAPRDTAAVTQRLDVYEYGDPLFRHQAPLGERERFDQLLRGIGRP